MAEGTGNWAISSYEYSQARMWMDDVGDTMREDTRRGP